MLLVRMRLKKCFYTLVKIKRILSKLNMDGTQIWQNILNKCSDN